GLLSRGLESFSFLNKAGELRLLARRSSSIDEGKGSAVRRPAVTRAAGGVTSRRSTRRSGLVAGLVGTLVAAAAAVPALVTLGSAANAATSGGVKFAYFDQWSIYQNAFYVKNLDTMGIAGRLDYLIYDFENIDPTNLTCFETTKATDPDPGGENDPNAGDG